MCDHPWSVQGTRSNDELPPTENKQYHQRMAAVMPDVDAHVNRSRVFGFGFPYFYCGRGLTTLIHFQCDKLDLKHAIP